MLICFALLILLLVPMVLWPVIRLLSKELARKLVAGFQMSAKCVSNRARFQKCEVRHDDRIKNAILKKVILRHPGWTGVVSFLIYFVAVLVVLGVIGAITLITLMATGVIS